jgi:hypothetical protein
MKYHLYQYYHNQFQLTLVLTTTFVLSLSLADMQPGKELATEYSDSEDDPDYVPAADGAPPVCS